MTRGSSIENRTPPEDRRLKSLVPIGGSSEESEPALALERFCDFVRGLSLPRCKPVLKTPDSFFRPATSEHRKV